MRGWDDQYGYELVPADVKLSFPKPDAELDRQIEKAITQAVRQQEAYLASGGMGGRGGNGNYPGATDSSPSADATPANSSMSNSGAPGGVAMGDDSGGTAPGSMGSSPVPMGSSPVPAKDLPVLSARDMDAYAQASGFAGRNNSPFPTDVARESAQRAAAEAAAARAAANQASKFAANRDGSAAGDGMASSSSTGGSTPGSDQTETNAANQGTTGRSGSQAGATAGGADARVANADKSGSSSVADETSTSGIPGDSDSASGSSPLAQQPVPKSATRGPGATSDPNAPIGGTQATGTSGNQDAASDQVAMDQSLPDGQSMNQVSAQVSKTIQPSQPVRQRVSRKGNDWALPREVAGSTGTAMVRMIRIECHEDRLVMLPERGQGQISVYGFGSQGFDQATLDLATDARDRISGWGAAMRNARWSPVMEVDVKPVVNADSNNCNGPCRVAASK